MKPDERKKTAEKFSGLDKILYDRLEKKVGTIQPDTSRNVIGGVILGVGGIVPFISTISTVPILMREIDKMEQVIEQSFSVDEVKEIINDLGVSSQLENTEKLKQIKEAVMDRETGLLNQLGNKDIEIDKKNEEIKGLKATA